jgi:acetyl-CoA acetyltransferase
MARDARNYAEVAVVRPVSVPYQKQSPHGPLWFIGAALQKLLEASGLSKDAIDGFAAASLMSAPDTTIAFARALGLSPRWLEWLPTGGASGVMSLQRAARAVQAGDAEIIACIAGDSARPSDFANLINNFSGPATAGVMPYGGFGPNGQFAMITRAYMERFGVERADFGRLVVQQRTNALAYAQALIKKPLELEDYLAARPIADPLGLYDCVPPCAGADGFLVMTIERAMDLGLPYARLLSVVERYNAFPEDDIVWRGGWALERERLYAQAGLTPADIDLVQTYDDYPVMSFIQLEDLGFCAKGEAAAFVRENDLTVQTPGLVHNSNGGQLSGGQAGAAGGFLGLVEALRQLTDQALGNPMVACDAALVAGYGMIIYDRCLCSGAAILARAEA